MEENTDETRVLMDEHQEWRWDYNGYREAWEDLSPFVK